MNEIWIFLKSNYEWFFSGLGIFIFSLIIAFFKFRKKSDSGDYIKTRGNQSPGKVGGDYKVEIYEQKKD